MEDLNQKRNRKMCPECRQMIRQEMPKNNQVDKVIEEVEKESPQSINNHYFHILGFRRARKVFKHREKL